MSYVQVQRFDNLTGSSVWLQVGHVETIHHSDVQISPTLQHKNDKFEINRIVGKWNDVQEKAKENVLKLLNAQREFIIERINY